MCLLVGLSGVVAALPRLPAYNRFAPFPAFECAPLLCILVSHYVTRWLHNRLVIYAGNKKGALSSLSCFMWNVFVSISS